MPNVSVEKKFFSSGLKQILVSFGNLKQKLTLSLHLWLGSAPFCPESRIYSKWYLNLEKTLERPLDWKGIQPVHPKGNQSWIYSLEGLMLKLKLKRQSFGHLMQRTDSLEKTLMLGKIEGWRRRGQQRIRWLDGIINSMEMSLGVDDGQGSLVCCSPWVRKELDTTERLNWTENMNLRKLLLLGTCQ